MTESGPVTEGTAGLYIHVPFCSFVCPYCDFAVERVKAGEVEAFVDVLLKEIGQARDFPHVVETVYFGGGTPSILPVPLLQKILAALESRFELLSDYRLHLEMNPEDAEAGLLRSYHDLGLRFLSLGIQSFVDSDLRFLGRRHTSEDAYRALDLAAATGFDTVSVDLMFGLPEQDFERWREQLDFVGQSPADHVSCYQLNVKPGTLFDKKMQLGRFRELGDVGQGDFFHETHERLEDHGLRAYEVSNFARNEASQSVHNKKYWDHSPYLGLGPSAHSFVGKRRFWNHRSTADWTKSVQACGHGVAGDEHLGPQELALEMIMLGLRQPQGFNLEVLRQSYQVDLAREAAGTIEVLVADGLLVRQGPFLRPTLTGLAVADAIAGDLASVF